jgi:hypothetical protein
MRAHYSGAAVRRRAFAVCNAACGAPRHEPIAAASGLAAPCRHSVVEAIQMQPSVSAISRQETRLLNPLPCQLAGVLPGGPVLIVAIDTEAEFNWRGPFRRSHTSVRNLRQQAAAQAIFDRFRVRPVYLVDYTVASQPDGYMPLREIYQSSGCEIGAHLHPWITPPFVEELGERTSFSHNLPPSLQRVKLARLTEAIIANLDIRPVAYRAGRYGVGEEIAEILEELDYRVDMSVLTGVDMRPLHGPDFRRTLDRPYWFGRDQALLEIPLTVGFVGGLADSALPKALAARLYRYLARPSLDRLRLRGAFARLRLLEWISLSPEGAAFDKLRRLTLALLARGNRLFVLSYHSSTLLPGSTEYVRSESDLSRFLRVIEQYLEFFIGEMGGLSMTPTELRAHLLREGVVAFPPTAPPVAAS